MADPYRVEWTATAKRNLARLPEKVATAVVEFVYGALRENPHRVGRPLNLELTGFHGARRGEFRVVYEIDLGGHRVLIRMVNHRADVYRPR
jgi:mRNA interferase RelE/StbE